MLKMQHFAGVLPEDIFLELPVEPKGSFSFLSPLGSRLTAWRRFGDWKFLRAEKFLQLIVEWGWIAG